jgi:putative holliday junction resolvase
VSALGALPPAGRLLAIDPGTRRVGVALSDGDRRLATPLEVVARTADPSVHRRRIAALAEEWEAVGLVVGLPRQLDGREGPAAEAARSEAAALHDLTGLPVALYDERLTTVQAERALAGAQLDGRGRRRRVDMVAAAVLLQGWLDAQRTTGEPPGIATPDTETSP